jgi:hypothetical protein
MGLFRTIGWRKHTLLIDEGETALLGNAGLRSMLNSGHCRDSANVMRADGVFNAWCPKAVALIGELPGSRRARAVVIELQRKLPGEVAAPLNRTAHPLSLQRRRRHEALGWSRRDRRQPHQHRPRYGKAVSIGLRPRSCVLQTPFLRASFCVAPSVKVHETINFAPESS